MEQSLVKCDRDIEALKDHWNEMVLNFEIIQESLLSVGSQISILTELPGLTNRIEQLEGYVYSGHESSASEASGEDEKPRPRMMIRPRTVTPIEKFIPKAEKITEKVSVADKRAVEVFKPILKKAERAQHVEEEYLQEEIIDSGFSSHKRFLAISRNIALIQDMMKKTRGPKVKAQGIYEDFDEDDDYTYDEPAHEAVQIIDDGFGVSREVVSAAIPKEMTAEHSSAGAGAGTGAGARAGVKSSTFTSPDILEEHSRQLRGQVIVFVKNRLHVFEIDLQHIESNLVTVKKKIELLEKSLKEIGEKLMFMDANFSQRIGDLAALKEMAESHQVSIVAIMHHLDRKAEAYAVNQKVSRKELTVIEDRVVKLCVLTSSEISKMEEKLSDSLEKLNLELNKKLFTEEFEVRLEYLLHKMKTLDNKLKDTPVERPVLDFDGIRPVEIKKFVLCKDGTRVKEARKKIATWKHRSVDSIVPVITHHVADREASPETCIQIQKELEQASIRESKRYAEGAYTKIHVGRK